MKLTNEQLKEKVAEENTCPICGSQFIDYGVAEIDCDTIFYPCECEKCGARFEETYTLNFVGHYNIVDDDNEIDFISK